MTYQLQFYVPESHLMQVKNALFAIGAGRQGEYEQTCWQTLGQGQFCPSSNANPAIGEHNKLTYVNEYKVEMICSNELISRAISVLKQVHPYEEPAYGVIRLETFK